MTSPRIGKFSTSTLVKWGDNTNFDGYLLVGFSIPTLSATPFPDIRIGNAGSPSERLPGFYKMPIENGVISTSCGLFYNADLVPRTTQYYAWLYTSAGFPVAGPSSAFSVTSDTITVPTFTVGTPAAGSTPTPDSDTNAVIPLQYYRLTGDVDGNGYDITGLDNVTGATASFSGAVGTGVLTCTALTSSGAVSGTTGTFSGVVKIPDGTNTAPGLEFSSDTNTGIYRSATDTINITAGGTARITANTSGASVAGTFSASGNSSVGGTLGVTGSTGVGGSASSYRVLNVTDIGRQFTDAAAGLGGFSVGVGANNTDQSIIMGVWNAPGSEYGWIQSTKAGTSHYKLALNVAGGDVQVGAGSWNGGHLLIGPGGHLWIDGSGKLRIKNGSAPVSDTDGTVVGTQT